jgi:filamin
VNITSPSGKVMAARIEETIDGFAAKFTAMEPGPHTIQVMFAGQPVPRSPFRVTAVQDAAVPAPVVGDPNKVKAFGPGLTAGKANAPANFTIDTREAGPGGLGLTIEGPSEAKIECFDKGDGTCDVRYWPTEPGEYTINILYNDHPIPKAPFKAQINPSKMVDVSSVRVTGPGIQPTGKTPMLNVSFGPVHGRSAGCLESSCMLFK